MDPTTPDQTPEEKPAGIGHNQGPAFDIDVFAEKTKSVDAFMRATKVWLDLEEITSDDQSSLASDQIAGLRKLHADVEQFRVDQRKPLQDQLQEIQDACLPVLKKLKDAANKIKPKIASFLTQKAEDERLKKEAELQAANLKKIEEQKKLDEANAANDVSAQVDAEEALKDADKDARRASKIVRVAAKSSSGGGRSIALRNVYTPEIINISKAFMHYRDNPEVEELLLRLAASEIRSAKEKEGYSIPGVKITHSTKAA